MDKNELSEFYFQEGLRNFLENNFDVAFYRLRFAARFNNSKAEWLVGHLLLNGGELFEKDTPMAIEYLTKASEKGEENAMYELAACYYCGEGVEKDLKVFIKLIKASAEKGNPSAADALARAYLEGEAIKRSYKLAVKWFLIAAEHGIADSMYSLYLRYAHGQGVEQNKDEAIRWLRKAANADHVVSQRILGECYYYGDNGLPEDKRLAFEYSLKAANQNDAEAAYCVALAYRDGNVVEHNVEAEKTWLRVAAEQDYPDAHSELARLLMGEKNESSWNEAMSWLKRGSELGIEDCQKGLQLMQELKGHDLSWCDLDII